MKKYNGFQTLFVVLTIFLVIYLSRNAGSRYFINQDQNIQFNGESAYRYLITQVNMGPRTPGSSAHERINKWIDTEMTKSGWEVVLQEGKFNGQLITNIIGKNSTKPPHIILAAHYDSRIFSDQDKSFSNRNIPVPGANDGASGVAVLLELAKNLSKIDLAPSIWIVFLDAEDNGSIQGWDWLSGSRLFVTSLDPKPRAAIILDMVGDKDLNIYREINSNQELTDEIWNVARSLNFGSFFIDQPKYSILDDHIPFIEAGIPAVDIIDFNYPYWHTIQDTADKTSAKSLFIVGSTVLNWIIMQDQIFTQGQ